MPHKKSSWLECMYHKPFNVLTFFVFPVFIYALTATNFSFNFFEPYFLWKGYNYYFLALINGQLDVPAHAIGLEASYIDDKVYMYYGALPLIARALLYPFVNLEQTSIAAFSVFIFAVIGKVYLQYQLLLKYQQASQNATIYFSFGFLLLSAVIWFGSATFVIVQNATLYHEPYAASLCLINLFFGLLVKDNFLLDKAQRYNLLPYALLAALCIHARMPSALALYCVVFFLILRQGFAGYNQNYLSSTAYIRKLVPVLLRQYKPLLVLMVGGLSILWLNYAKFGEPLAFMGRNYGYFFFEVASERLCGFVPRHEFSPLLRIIPNTVIYLTGSSDLHWSLSWHLGTGFGRKEAPLIATGLLWLLPLACFIGLIGYLFKNRSCAKAKYLAVILGLSSVGAIVQLTYPTIAHRYIADLWFPIGLALTYFAYRFVCRGSEGALLGPSKPYWFYGIVLFGVLGMAYQAYLSVTERYYLQDGPIYKHYNHHYFPEQIAVLEGLNAEKIKAFKASARAQRKQACKDLAETTGIDKALEKERNNKN